MFIQIPSSNLSKLCNCLVFLIFYLPFLCKNRSIRLDPLNDMRWVHKKISKSMKMELVGKATLDEYGLKKLKA
jgi:hypothetical protein